MKRQRFIPALRYTALTPAYDFLIRVTIPEARFKSHLIACAAIGAGDRVLDVGCGTGTLLALAAARHPAASFIGVDPDSQILDYARRKLQRLQNVTLEQGSAAELPFDSGSFDRVLSSLVIHHLTAEQKRVAMREIMRVLRAGGAFHLGDFGQPDTRAMRIASFLTEKIGREHVAENFRGLLPTMLREAGFAHVEETGRFTSVFGVLRTVRATKAS